MTDPLSNYARTASARLGCRGIFYGTSLFTVQAAAHAATAGFMWLLAPASGSDYLVVRRCSILGRPATAAAFPSAPQVRLERMTFTALAGALVTPGKGETADYGNVGTLRTGAPTNPAAGAALASTLIVPVLGATFLHGEASPDELIDKDDPITLVNLEGLVVRQATAATAGDTRILTINWVWEEYDDA